MAALTLIKVRSDAITTDEFGKSWSVRVRTEEYDITLHITEAERIALINELGGRPQVRY